MSESESESEGESEGEVLHWPDAHWKGAVVVRRTRATTSPRRSRLPAASATPPAACGRTSSRRAPKHANPKSTPVLGPPTPRPHLRAVSLKSGCWHRSLVDDPTARRKSCGPQTGQSELGGVLIGFATVVCRPSPRSLATRGGLHCGCCKQRIQQQSQQKQRRRRPRRSSRSSRSTLRRGGCRRSGHRRRRRRGRRRSSGSPRRRRGRRGCSSRRRLAQA